MANTATTKGRKAATPIYRASGSPKDAIGLLKADHDEVRGWFDDYEDLSDDARKATLAGKICLALTVHAQIEEEIFYPAARQATKDDELLDEAKVEHAGAKQLVAQIEAMKAGNPLFDAKVKVLGEQVKHHIKEEESKLFPEAKKAKMNLIDLGERLSARKAALMAQLKARH